MQTVEVLRSFRIGGRLYGRGVRPLLEELGEDLASLVEGGYVARGEVPEPAPDVESEGGAEPQDAPGGLAGLDLGEDDVEILVDAGLGTRSSLAEASDERILDLKGIGPAKLRTIRGWLAGG